jgi:hypothetical protein
MLLPAMASASGFPAILSINMSPVITAAMNEPSVLPQEVVRTSSSLQNAAQTWGERNAVFHQHCSPSETPPPSPMTRRRASPIKADRNTRCPPPQALWTAETVPKGLYSTEAPGAAGVVASPAARWLDAEHDRAGRVKVGVDLAGCSPGVSLSRHNRRRRARDDGAKLTFRRPCMRRMRVPLSDDGQGQSSGP